PPNTERDPSDTAVPGSPEPCPKATRSAPPRPNRTELRPKPSKLTAPQAIKTQNIAKNTIHSSFMKYPG
ncbi:MAG TPA: hypothetical protein VKN76_00825, partial [Kiloniellaceae bacterium]|nr:hypothetical protein [Kiloniellaceae bacterium]